MIYDAVIFTGDATISGCHSAQFFTDNFNLLNKNTAGAENEHFFDRSLLRENNTIQLNLNSQTLTQEVPITGQATNKIVFSINTGDFFIKNTGQVDVVDRNRLFFDNGKGELRAPVKSESNLVYNYISGVSVITRGDQGQSLKDSINNAMGSSYVFNDMDYFLNGQKVYSGVGVGVKDGTVKTTTFDNDPISNGVVTLNNKDNFKYAAYRKRPKSNSITGISPDVFGSGFIEKRTNFYINGMLELQSSYLELYTGVTMIEKDKKALISGSLAGDKFKVSVKNEFLSL